MEFYFQSDSVMNNLKCPKLLSHCLTELFPIYQNKYWTIIVIPYYIEDCQIFTQSLVMPKLFWAKMGQELLRQTEFCKNRNTARNLEQTHIKQTDF